MDAANRIRIKMTRIRPPQSVGIMPKKAEPEPYLPPNVSRFDVMDNNVLPEKEKPNREQPQGLSGILEKFCTSTSMHGCGQINGAKLTTGRIIWSLLTLGAVGGLMFHLYSVFYSYYKWPIHTKVSLGFGNLRYPAITLCNVNRIRKSRLIHGQSEEMENLKELVELIDPDALIQKLQGRRISHQSMSSGSFTTNTSSVETNNRSEEGNFTRMYKDINLTTYDSDVYSTDVNETTGDDWDTDMSLQYLVEMVFETSFFSVDRTTRFRAGHDIAEMLISCMFNGRMCYAENFTLYQTSSYGNCWTLSSPKLVAKSAGVRSGLSLILYLQTDEYISGLTNGYGIKMLVHDTGINPLPQDEGILIPAATESNIGLFQKTIKRLDGRYGDCDDGAAFRERVGIEYSRQTCHVVCDVYEVYKECGCYGSYYEEIALRLDKGVRACNTTGDKICMNHVKWNLQQKNKVCRCDNPCNEVVYGMSVSVRQWPTESFANLLLEGVCENDPSDCLRMRARSNDTRDVAYVNKNNFVKLNIFYETLNYEMIEEEPLIDIYQFLASIGGAQGLWIGLSLLSFCEIMQLLGDVLGYLVERCRHTAHYNNNSVET